MGKRGNTTLQEDFLQGTLDVLILRTLVLGPAHGHTIASEWGVSDNNRKARFYKLTRAGRRELAQQTSRWETMARAVTRILRPASAKGSRP